MNSAELSRRCVPPLWDHQRHLLRKLADSIRATIALNRESLAGASVCDFGAGDAPYRPLFLEAEVSRYLACDLGPEAEIPIESGHPVPIDSASMDWVVSFQVLEHVWDLDWYLGEARRLVKPESGRLLLSTHGVWLYHPHPTDFRRWTRDGLVREIESRGFVVENVIPIAGPLAWTTQFRLLGYREVFRKIPLLGGMLTAAMCIVMNLRMEVEDWITPRSILETNAAVYVVIARPAAGEDA